MRVARSAEIDRIVNLPSRSWDDQDLADLAATLTGRYKLRHGTMSLRPQQARVLAEAYQANGCYAALPVGAGKTLVSYLLPVVMQAKRPLLMVPASLKEKTFSDFADLRNHWMHVRSYPVISLEQIQTPNSRKLLDKLNPDLLIIDEAQNIASHKSTRTKRIIEYMNSNPSTKMVALTGTPLRISVMDYWHIVRSCLRDAAPLPAGRAEMERWAEALDTEVTERRAPGALGEALGARDIHTLRTAFKNRMRDTWGFVSIVESSCDMPIKLTVDSSCAVPTNVMEAIEIVRDTGETINEDVLESGAHVREHIGELVNGFYYFWEPPPPQHWRQARKHWHKFLREQCDKPGVNHDSPALVARAFPNHPLQVRWKEVRDEYDPEENRTLKWLSEYAIKHTIEYIGNTPTIVWVKQIETGVQLSRLSGWCYYGGGKQNSRDLVELSKSQQAGKSTIILSINAHHQGQNLQAWSNLYYLTCPSSVRLWEQSIGRVHRPLQENAVNITVFAPIQELRDSFKKALDRSEVIYELTGQLQKLLDAKIKRKKK